MRPLRTASQNCGVVALVLVRVSLREVGDRPVELVASIPRYAAIAIGSPDRACARASVCPQSPAYSRARRAASLRRLPTLHVAELAPIEMAVRPRPLRPAQEDVAGGLHQPLALHDALSGLRVSTLREMVLQHRRGCLLDLQEQRVLSSRPCSRRMKARVRRCRRPRPCGPCRSSRTARAAGDGRRTGFPGSRGTVRGRTARAARRSRPCVSARSRKGMTTGGWLTIRYRPSTCSASFESAWRLSRVLAFFAAFRAFLAAFLSGALDRLSGSVDDRPSSSASESAAYQMSSVPISAKRPSTRDRPRGGDRRGSGVGLGEFVVARGDREARGHALDVVLEGSGERLVEVVEVEHERPLGRRKRAEVRKVRVSAELHVEPGRRGVLQIRGHDLRRAPVEGEG